MAPAWRNNGEAPQSLTGAASDFTGPSGASYTLALDTADYGALDPDETASCRDAGVCYQMGVDDPAVHPAPHWDAAFDETLWHRGITAGCSVTHYSAPLRRTPVARWRSSSARPLD